MDLSNTITVLTAINNDSLAGSSSSQILRYDVPSQQIAVVRFETTPPFGPRAVSADQTGTNVVVASRVELNPDS